jgi:leucyl aminopeptidase (aminopeptidase T)
MPDRLATANIDIDPELMPGAHNAVSVCLQLTPEERVTIITDEATCDIAAALRAEVEEIGFEYTVFVLENYATRPRRLDRPSQTRSHKCVILKCQSVPSVT